MIGRPRSQPPKLAYDYRRYIALVQVLAIAEPFERKQSLILLATQWGVTLTADPFSLPSSDIAHRIAEHAVEYHRSEG